VQSNVNLEPGEVRRWLSWATEAWDHGSQATEDFLQQGARRGRSDFLADQTEGKLAEMAFARFAEQFGVDVQVSSEHWADPSVADNHNDLEHVRIRGREVRPPFATDVKGTKGYSQWLLAEEPKASAPAAGTSDPDRRYVLVKLGLPDAFFRDPEGWDRGDRAEPVSATVAGWAKASELFIRRETGERLWTKRQIDDAAGDPARLLAMAPQVKCPLKAPNRCLPAIWLHRSEEDWLAFFSSLEERR